MSTLSVWRVIGDWADGRVGMARGHVVSCEAAGDVRVVTFAKGTIARERLVARDEVARRIVYSLIGDTVRPEHDNIAMQIVPDGAGSCRFIWLRDVLPDELAEPLHAAMQEAAPIIKRTLEGVYLRSNLVALQEVRPPSSRRGMYAEVRHKSTVADIEFGMATKRPRNAAQTRADILAAARRRFATEGYEGTTLRAVAADVGVDAALVICYFGSKKDLFATAVEFMIELPDLSGVDPDDFAGMLLPRYFAVWEENHTFLALLRAAMTSKTAAETLCQARANHVAPKLIASTPDHHQQRIALTDAFIIGLATTRSVLANPPIANLSRDELSRWAAPVIRQLLVGPAPS